MAQIRERRNPTKQPVKKTEAYFPPMVSKVTEFSAIQQYTDYLQSLVGLTLNITMDVETAFNAFKFLWNGLEKYQNVVIHLGDFYFTKDIFQVICLRKNRNHIQKSCFLFHRLPILKCCVRVFILREFFLINRKQCVMVQTENAATVFHTRI